MCCVGRSGAAYSRLTHLRGGCPGLVGSGSYCTIMLLDLCQIITFIIHLCGMRVRLKNTFAALSNSLASSAYKALLPGSLLLVAVALMRGTCSCLVLVRGTAPSSVPCVHLLSSVGFFRCLRCPVRVQPDVHTHARSHTKRTELKRHIHAYLIPTGDSLPALGMGAFVTSEFQA